MLHVFICISISPSYTHFLIMPNFNIAEFCTPIRSQTSAWKSVTAAARYYLRRCGVSLDQWKHISLSMWCLLIDSAHFDFRFFVLVLREEHIKWAASDLLERFAVPHLAYNPNQPGNHTVIHASSSLTQQPQPQQQQQQQHDSADAKRANVGDARHSRATAAARRDAAPTDGARRHRLSAAAARPRVVGAPRCAAADTSCASQSFSLSLSLSLTCTLSTTPTVGNRIVNTSANIADRRPSPRRRRRQRCASAARHCAAQRLVALSQLRAVGTAWCRDVGWFVCVLCLFYILVL
jgi:hypothetical protein